MSGRADTATTTVRVRPGRPGELAEVARLVAEAGLPLAGVATRAACWVAEDGETLVRAAALEEHGTGAARVFLLRSVAVHPAWRGRGLGAALTATALQHTDRQRAPVALLTETAPSFFPRFGFIPLPREQLPAALSASAELRGACPASASALLRPAPTR